jgi:hypothetical protein
MSEPIRLLDDPNASPEAASLLRSLSAPVAPSPAKQAELAQHLATLTKPALVATGATSTALWVKTALVAGALGVAATWGVLSLRHTASPALPVASALPAPPLAPEPAPAVAELPSVAGTAEPTAREAPVVTGHSKLAVRDTLADEEALLEQARRLAGSSPSRALGLLQQYQRRFPAGQLSAERMFLSVDVLTRLGNTQAARSQADALIRAFPTSVYASQVKARSSHPD